MKKPRGKCIAIMGATATGKSDAAVDLALRFGGEVISMDSRQVYRGMDIGTGKTMPDEQRGVPHHLIDTHDPSQRTTAGEHVEAARQLVADIRERGHVPFLVGGTGLYFRGFFEGLIDVRIPPEEQEKIRAGFEKRETDDLYAELASRDAARARELSPNDRVRIMRALELIAFTGRPVTELYAQQRKTTPQYDTLRIVLSMPRETLRARIAARTRGMFAAGWVREVRGLLDAGVDPKSPGMESLGYAVIANAIVAGEEADDAVEEVILETQQYAKRQETFFRSVSAAQWFNSSDSACDGHLAAAVARFLDLD